MFCAGERRSSSLEEEALLPLEDEDHLQSAEEDLRLLEEYLLRTSTVKVSHKSFKTVSGKHPH